MSANSVTGIARPNKAQAAKPPDRQESIETLARLAKNPAGFEKSLANQLKAATVESLAVGKRAQKATTPALQKAIGPDADRTAIRLEALEVVDAEYKKDKNPVKALERAAAELKKLDAAPRQTAAFPMLKP